MKQNLSMQTKKAFFFSHDSNARNDEKIINLRMQHGAEGYGVYFMLIEMLLESTDYKLAAQYPALAFNLRVDREVLRSVIEDFDLFQFSSDSTSFYSHSLNERMKPLEQIREKRRRAGVRSGEVRRAKAASRLKTTKVSNVETESSDNKCNMGGEDVIMIETIEPTVFVPPTESELSSYCIENKIDVDFVSFIDFYQSKGWMIGKNEMRDWRAALRNWQRNETYKSNNYQQTRSQLNATKFYNDKAYERF